VEAGLRCDPPIRFGTSTSKLLLPTLSFHRLMEKLTSVAGPVAATAFQELCFAAFFEREEALTDSLLATLASGSAPAVFSSPAAAETFLAGPEMKGETMERAERVRRRYNCSGVPLFVAKVGDKVSKCFLVCVLTDCALQVVETLSGAQPVPIMVAMIRKLRAEHAKLVKAPVVAAPEAGVSEKRCAECGAGATLRCGGCRGVAYCSAACQRKNWSHHAAECKRAKQEKAAEEAGQCEGGVCPI
jgi:hypothetical protein